MNKLTKSFEWLNSTDFNEFILKNLENKPKYIFLIGELGAGKTTLVKRIAKLLGERKTISSPSFNYIKIYDKLVHIDAYNLTDGIDEFEDYFEDKIVIVEWANKFNYQLYKNALIIKIEYNNQNTETRNYYFERIL